MSARCPDCGADASPPEAESARDLIVVGWDFVGHPVSIRAWNEIVYTDHVTGKERVETLPHNHSFPSPSDYADTYARAFRRALDICGIT